VKLLAWPRIVHNEDCLCSIVWHCALLVVHAKNDHDVMMPSAMMVFFFRKSVLFWLVFC